jgi:putative transposase
MLIEPQNPLISISRQCSLLGISRPTYYLQPAGESAENLLLMKLIDEQYTNHPSSGSRTMLGILRNAGYNINRKRIQRLMQQMGLAAVYPKPKTTLVAPEHKKYPYLLRNLPISYPNQVWCADITYIRMRHGFMYLTAVMDWFSRYVLSWRLSNTLDSQFCLDAVEGAFEKGKPEIFNTDQGVQFTSTGFTARLIKAEVQISMDGKGRCLDNVFIERLWRSVKYELIYLNEFESAAELFQGLFRYFDYYNHVRPHQALGLKSPYDIHKRQKNDSL